MTEAEMSFASDLNLVTTIDFYMGSLRNVSPIPKQ